MPAFLHGSGFLNLFIFSSTLDLFQVICLLPEVWCSKLDNSSLQMMFLHNCIHLSHYTLCLLHIVLLLTWHAFSCSVASYLVCELQSLLQHHSVSNQ